MVSPNVSDAVSPFKSVTVSVAVVVPEPDVVKLKGFDTALWLRPLANVHVTVEVVPTEVGEPQTPPDDTVSAGVNVKNALS
jgi:hypothetical protein